MLLIALLSLNGLYMSKDKHSKSKAERMLSNITSFPGSFLSLLGDEGIGPGNEDALCLYSSLSF